MIRSMTAYLNSLSIIVVSIIGRASPAHDGVAFDPLPLKSKVIASVFNLVTPVALIRISICNILELHVSLLVYERLVP